MTLFYGALLLVIAGMVGYVVALVDVRKEERERFKQLALLSDADEWQSLRADVVAERDARSREQRILDRGK